MTDYKRIARFYDIFLFPIIISLRKKIVNIINEKSNQSVIDLCCGTGNQLNYLHKNGISNICGIDLSSYMLEKAKNYPFSCTIGDASNTGRKDSSFDIAMISFALHEMDQDTALAIVKEAIRIIKDSGRIIILDYIKESEMNPFTLLILNMIERIAGKEHYANYKSYQQNGGMAYLTKELKLIEGHRFNFKGVDISIFSKK